MSTDIWYCPVCAKAQGTDCGHPEAHVMGWIDGPVKDFFPDEPANEPTNDD